MEDSSTLADTLAIQALVAAYNDAVMRFDGDAWIGNWAEGATWELPGAGAISGREAILAVWQGAMAELEFVGFFASPGPLQLDGDRASGRWYQQEFLHYRGGLRRDITGRYEDRYVRTDGRWLFAHRAYTILQADERRPGTG